MKRLVMIAAALLLLGSFVNRQLGAADTPPATPYSGDIWARSTLTGDWGGSAIS